MIRRNRAALCVWRILRKFVALNDMEQNDKSKDKARSRRRPWLWVVIPMAVLVSVVLLLLVAGVWILTPQRLTALTRKYGTEYLVDGRVDVARVDLTWWSTFPRIELTVDSLSIVSLDPSVPDSVSEIVSVERLQGALQLPGLAGGNIDLRDVEIVRPSACVYVGNGGVSNLNVFSTSPDDKDIDDGPLQLPAISINRFVIEGAAPLRYVSEPDSIDAKLTLHKVSLADAGHPVYEVSTAGGVRISSLPLPDDMMLGIDGRIGWDPAEPMKVNVDGLTLSAGEVSMTVSADADLSDGVTVETFAAETDEIPVEYLMSLARLMPEVATALPDVKTDMALKASVRLRSPYVPERNPFPTADVRVELSDAPFEMPAYRLQLKKIGLKADIAVNADSVSASTVTVERFVAEGIHGGTFVEFKGSATDLLTDPRVEGCFRGLVRFDNLPAALYSRIGMKMRGVLKADVDFRMRISDMSERTFHRANLKGNARLRDFSAVSLSDSLITGVDNAEFRFGTSDSFVRDEKRTDSLLTASLRIDSAYVVSSDIKAEMKLAKIGVGCRNDASVADTSVITPLGAVMEIGLLRYVSETDTIRAIMRDMKAGAMLRRYSDMARIPQIGAGIKARRIVYADGFNRMTLRDGDISVTAHLRPRRDRSSGRRGNTHTRRSMRRDSTDARSATSGHEYLDMSVDSATARMLRRWNVNGNVKARSGRLFTPYFPLRMSMRDLDFGFTTDSLDLKGVDMKIGRSDFHVSGKVSNLRRSLTGRGHSPVRVDFTLSADTINVNELTRAAFQGGAFVNQADSLSSSGELDMMEMDDDALQARTDSMTATEMVALLVPMNIKADLAFKAANIVYSNMLLHDFSGKLLVNRGAVNLSDLTAFTDIGSIDLNALYSAPTVKNIQFAMGLRLNRFRIDRVTQMLPVLDSLMPVLGSMGGVIDVGIGATTKIDSAMNLEIPSLRAMVNMSGDSLVLLDPETFKVMSKWLMFKDKGKNMIDHMKVELAVENSMLELYPFMFDFDRYRLGVMGRNDLNLNLNYHVSVLKSPFPFKFGINITGQADDMKVRVGRARFNDYSAGERVALADSVRVNLVDGIRSVFRRGTDAARVGPLEISRRRGMALEDSTDTISSADSILFINNGLIEAPDTTVIKPIAE